MSASLSENSAIVNRGRFSYGWVVVASCTLLIGITYGLLYSYSVFFKPVAVHFGWDRATASLIYSTLLIIRGAVSIGTGWLADKYGPKKLMVFCGLMIGLGLVLSSQVQTLWQFFITYAVIEGIGFSGAYGIGAAIISRWFTKNRGLPLGILASGSGLGVLFLVPGTERLIDAFSWSQAFIICGIFAGVFMIVLALLLRPAPQTNPVTVKKPGSVIDSGSTQQAGMSARQAIRDPRMILLLASFLFFFFGTQLVMVHLVNYATDVGISPLVAATFISTIGAVSIVGRLSTGVAAEKIGIHNTMVLTRLFLVASFVFLIFTHSLWAFYLFAVIFSIPYGGEVAQVPIFIGKFFGTRAMATLVGWSLFMMSIGGALGSWVAGEIFDATRSYHWAFITGAASGFISLLIVLVLLKKKQ